MHTMTQLAVPMFGVSLDGQGVEVGDLLPRWDRADRFGIVMNGPFGASGANLLIQAAITAFYGFQRTSGKMEGIYPEIYYFHLGRWHGDLSHYDAWPPYKEVLVVDPGDLGRTIAERAITWLAVPDGPRAERPDRLTPEQKVLLNALAFRLRGGFAYGAEGVVDHPDVEIWSRDAVTEENLRLVLDPDAAIHALRNDYPEDSYLIPTVESRVGEVDAATRRTIAAKRVEDGRADGGRELYRRLGVTEVVAAIPTPTPL